MVHMITALKLKTNASLYRLFPYKRVFLQCAMYQLAILELLTTEMAQFLSKVA